MAEDGSWPSIQKHGLLSTSALLDKWGYVDRQRETIENNLRPEKITICSENIGRAVIRDQKAMRRERLESCLTNNITVEEWCTFINKRVFFWADWTGLKILISAGEYFNRPQTVITVDTRRLLHKYRDKISLSPINTGSTFARRGKLNPEPRNFDTFQRIPDYNHRWIQEIAVDYSVLDIAEFTLSVDRYISKRKGFENEPEHLGNIWKF